ncbi:uncharacterized protein LOC131613476 [Vicia villosa]|uniref:uncharacterized protein LOC131613476 n=1 Tax=Vicia villosa TaxID=3911 RepID=UPI00273C5A1B|nr:uncharacterized protein LOC131613476 [Vicia villosa]
MIIGNLNIRGGGSLLKRKRISKIIKEGNTEIFLIQEYKLNNMDQNLVKSLWNREKVGWSYSSSTGNSGGITTLWKEESVEEIFSFKGEGFLEVKLCSKGICFYVVNIYSPCALEQKRKLRESIIQLRLKYSDADWVLDGDFNAVCIAKERRGRSLVNRKAEMEGFSQFVETCELQDVPCKGKCFSWFIGDGHAASRIDRFLLSEDLISSWGVVGQRIGNRYISEHYPVWLMVDKEDWGPKPFMFNNTWFEDKNFLPFIESEWNKLKVVGRSDFVLKEKLRLLKYSLRKWNVNVFGKVDLEIKEGVEEINELDEFVSWCNLNQHAEAIQRRSVVTSRM